MLYAAMLHPKVIGGKITEITNIDEVESMPGVKKVVLTEYGAAVIADNTWRAKNGTLVLETIEDHVGNDAISSDEIQARLTELLDAKPIATPESEGDVDGVIADSDAVIEGTYKVPYLAHAAMEPLNCTALINDDSAEVWVGHQATSVVLDMIAQDTGISKQNIKVNITYLGGGFGRRGEPDFLKKAVAVAMEMKGTPIQTVFTREEDMKNLSLIHI